LLALYLLTSGKSKGSKGFTTLRIESTLFALEGKGIKTGLLGPKKWIRNQGIWILASLKNNNSDNSFKRVNKKRGKFTFVKTTLKEFIFCAPKGGSIAFAKVNEVHNIFKINIIAQQIRKLKYNSINMAKITIQRTKSLTIGSYL
jgi:hypothetical protein